MKSIMDKLFDGLSQTTAVALVIVLFILVLLIAPFFTIWAVNTIAEQAGTDFYIPHSFWSYVATLVILILFSGSSKND